MSRVRIQPSSLRGGLNVPLSKSAAHRVLICSSLAGQPRALPAGETVSGDLHATEAALRSLLRETGPNRAEPTAVDCGESGSTLRFLIPVAAALGISAVFTGHGRLPQRPIGVYGGCLLEHGVRFRTDGGLPLAIDGKLLPGRFSLPGNVSSQFITGLLLALPLLDGDSEIVLTTPLESSAYADMTVRTMRDFGVTAVRTKSGWSVPGNQRYQPNPGCEIERDWSQAAFFLAAGMFGGPVALAGLNPRSLQGDRAAETLFRGFGANLLWKDGVLTASRGPDPRPGEQTIDASQIPDLVPVLAAAASLLPGRRTVLARAGRLRLKESDRLAAMAEGLNRLGGAVRETPDGLVIDGVPALTGGRAEGKNDHRVVMALAVAALRCKGETTITDAQSIGKSYPDFFRDYNRLGGKAHVLGE